MNRHITIAAAQYPITAFPTVEAWQHHLSYWVKTAVEKGAEVLLFPEYAAMELVSLFESAIREDLQLQLEALQDLLSIYRKTHLSLAQEHQCVIVAGSFPVKENGVFKNRVYVFSQKGEVGHQDKHFMTRFENESWGITGEKEHFAVFRGSWGAFGIQTCYDVEFPHGANVLCRAGATLLLAPSCTETVRGATRVHVGARARALENQCYTVVSQTIGYTEWSPAVDINYGFAGFYTTPDINFPENGILLEGQHQQIGWEILKLNMDKIDTVRKEGQVLNFRDQPAHFTEKNINVTVYDL